MKRAQRQLELEAEREFAHYAPGGKGSWVDMFDSGGADMTTPEVERCLIVDVETTGFDDPDQHLIELGAILYSVTNQSSLMELSLLMPGAGNPAERVNRIKPAALQEMSSIVKADGTLEMASAALIRSALMASQVIVSYNNDFDARYFNAADYIDKPMRWRCCMSDFKWPEANREQGSLIHLALDHGIGVANAHRALADCRLIAQLFDRMTDLPAMFRRAMRPKALFLSLASFDDKDIVKAHGFKWNGQTKEWTRTMAVQDADDLPFKVKQIGASIS